MKVSKVLSIVLCLSIMPLNVVSATSEKCAFSEAKSALLSDNCNDFYDTNGDGIVNVLDAVRIKKDEFSLSDYSTELSTCYCYGDSLTWYDGQAYTWGAHKGEICVGFESYLRSRFGLTVTNVGISGATTPQMCNKLKSDTEPQTADIITIMGGDNDDRLGVPVGNLMLAGSTFDTTTVYGSLQSAIETVLNSNPTARIIIMTEPMGWTYRNDAMERVNDVYPNAYRSVAEYYGLALIDVWRYSGINEITRNTYYADPTPENNQLYMYHPNNDGWKRISRYMCEELRKYF